MPAGQKPNARRKARADESERSKLWDAFAIAIRLCLFAFLTSFFLASSPGLTEVLRLSRGLLQEVMRAPVCVLWEES